MPGVACCNFRMFYGNKEDNRATGGEASAKNISGDIIMLAEYKNKFNGAVWVCVISGIALFTAVISDEGNIFENGNILAIASAVACIVSFFYTIWVYAKARG